jgi:hypothetical protein
MTLPPVGFGKRQDACHLSIVCTAHHHLTAAFSQPVQKLPVPRRTHVFTHSLDLYNRHHTHVVCFAVRVDSARAEDRHEMQGWNNLGNIGTRRVLGSRRSQHESNGCGRDESQGRREDRKNRREENYGNTGYIDVR